MVRVLFTYDPDLRAHLCWGLARGSIIFHVTTPEHGVVWDLVFTVLDPPLVTVLFANINSLFCAWSYGTHMPMVLAVRGWHALTVR
jgi:hypothetical protein